MRPHALALSLLAIGCHGRESAAPADDPAALVEALGSQDAATREAAASRIHRVLSEDPGRRFNDHGRPHWEARVDQVKKGMNHANAVRILPPMNARNISADWSGQTGTRSWRLDHYWEVIVQYGLSPAPGATACSDSDVVLEKPQLRERAMSVWVKPPPKFTGKWVTFHVNGQKHHEIEYRDGGYHGTLIAYYDNGRRAFEQHYQNGLANGPDIGWFRDGARSYTGQYRAGNRDGTWTHWHENGAIRSQEQLEDGRPHGVTTRWHPDGQKQHETHFVDGVQHGTDTYWDGSGRVLWAREYRDGKILP